MAILLKHRWIAAEGHVGSKENLTPINTGRLPLVALESKHHGSHMNISSLKFFFSNEPSSKSYVRNAVSGMLFTAINVEKRQFEKSVDVEINNIIYMELYSGPEILDGKYLKS
jgi:hypothetical protein